jgi:ribosomal protein L11 methyltransferase
MYSLFVECADSEVEMLSAELWEEGATGIQEDSLPASRCQLRAWFEDPAGLLQRFDHYRPRLEADPEIDWETASRQAWQPFTVGKRLYLAPEWDEGPTPRGRIRLTIHPGEALGTGAHPATQLCLEALESHLRARDYVLDLGTGSGILTAAASHLGARRAFGCDMDPRSVHIARRNLLADGLPPHLFAGSTRAIRSRSVDVVAANINALTHQTLAAEYARISRRLLILSGFPDRNCSKVSEALEPFGYRVLDTLTRNEWICLILCNAVNS